MYQQNNLLTGFTSKLRFVSWVSEITLICKAFPVEAEIWNLSDEFWIEWNETDNDFKNREI